ncbi:MAG TPA: FtsX-like permease family protein [Chloroflexota bacterium]|nr:FtsX-like permease family protein [Chloroflexota bacterium]
MSFVSVLLMVIKRIINNINLMLASIVGLVITVTLVASIPLYSEGMSEALLRRQLTETTEQVQPKSSILLRHFEEQSPGQAGGLTAPSSGGTGATGGSGTGSGAGSQSGSGGASSTPAPAPVVSGNVYKKITIEDYQRANKYLTDDAGGVIGLPRKLYVTYGQTDSLPLLMRTDDLSLTGREFAGYGFIAYIRDFEKHVRMLDGRLPNPQPAPNGDLEAVMATAGLDEIGLEVGDRIVVVWEKNGVLTPVNVTITGRWYPQNPQDTYWFYQLDYFNNAIVLPEQAFFEHVAKPYDGIAHEYAWFMVFDVNAIRSNNVGRVLEGINELRSHTATILGNVRMEISPEALLQDYEVKLFFLKILLFVLSAPIICIVLYYITIAAGMIIDRQRNEIAILKSRGASMWQVVGVYLTEGSIFGLLAIVVGPILGMIVAQFIGRTYTFLVFSNRELLPVHITAQTVQFAGLAVAMSVGAMLVPAIGASRHSIVTYKQEVARQTRGPFWQRWFIDFLLLAIAGYGYYLLSGRQSILTLGEAGDVFSDPLLLLVPALFIFACALIFLRLFPVLIELLSRLGGRFFGVSVLLGLRHIGRMPGQYTRLVLLLTLTLALGTFAASVAKTLDRNYTDRVYYQTGSDLQLVESGAFDELSETWSFQPVSDHLQVKALKSVARVFRTTGNANITGRGRPQEVKIMAVDPPDFARVSWWREDFAGQHFVALLNGLASDERGAIVDEKFLADFKLKVGDSLVVNVKQKPVDFTITGVVSYWPTLWPDTERFFVVNLDYVFDQIGASPYDVWARTDGVTPPQQIVNELRELDFIVSRFVDARETALRLRDDPGRTGIFGILTVGFLVAALLTILGFMLYSFLSAKRRMQQLGILRAMGLSIRQLISLFLFEQGFLIFLGVVVGTILGVLTGSLFIPFLQIKSEAHAGIPKFVVMTAWDDIVKIYVLFAFILAIAFPAFIWMLARMKIHEAIKFGEEQG